MAAVCVTTTSFAQTVNCTCRYQGEDFSIGESICLKGSNGMKMATCSMVLNNTSWKFSNAPCPLSLWQDEDNPEIENAENDPETSQTPWQKATMTNLYLN